MRHEWRLPHTLVSILQVENVLPGKTDNLEYLRHLSPSAADASGAHASTTVVDRGGGTPPSPVGRLASMPVEDAPGGGGRKTNVVES